MTVLVVLVLGIGAALYLSDSRVSSLLKAVLGIEAGAEELLAEAVGTEVTIESIDVSLIGGEITIRGLTVANPEGFLTEHAIEAGEIHVAVELGTLLDDTVVVREIALESPLVTYELGANGSNLDAILRNVESAAGSGEGPGGGTPTRRILVRHLYVRGGRVAASAVFLEGKSWKVPLPDIHLENISSGAGGVAVADVVGKAASEIARNAQRAVPPIRELAGEVEDRIAGRASKVLEAIKREVETGSGTARNALEQGSESARETLERGSGALREALKKKAETARERLEKGTESTRKALEKGTESTREALREEAESAREALGKGTEKVKNTLDRLLGKQTE